MGAMSQLASEKEEALSAAHWEYLDAYAAYEAFMTAHPPAHRKLEDQKYLDHLEGVCSIAKYHYETLKANRYRV